MELLDDVCHLGVPRSTTGCVQNGFLAYGALGANRAPILHQN